MTEEPAPAKFELLVRGEDGENFELREVPSVVGYLNSRPRRVGPELYEVSELRSRLAKVPGASPRDVHDFVHTVMFVQAAGTPPALEQAASLYQGDLLAGLVLNEAPFEEWLLGERERLRELALGAFARLLAQQRAAGRTEAAAIARRRGLIG